MAENREEGHFLTRFQNENAIYWAYAIPLSFVLFIVHYAIMQVSFFREMREEGNLKNPPLIPYPIPLVGNVPWQYLWDPIRFFSTSKYFARIGHPVRAKFLTKEIYIIEGPEHVLSLLGHTSTSNRIFNSSFLRHACGMSSKGVARFDSALEETPNYHGRKNYLDATPLYSWSSAEIHTYLTGKSAFQLSRRFETNLRTRMQAYFAATSREGIVLKDFSDFFATEVISALVESMCGKGLIDRNPDFPGAFWIFCDNMGTFMKRTPYIFAKEAWNARDDAVAAVKSWHAWASSNFDATITPLDKNGDDEYWGSKFFRERYKTLVYDMGFDPGDMASLDLGFLLGASANTMLNTYWCVLEVFRDVALLRDIRMEVESCKLETSGGGGDSDNDLRFDVTRLLQQPLLQAVFSETLRLRCHNMFMRTTSEPIRIGKWLIPGNRYAVAWSTPVQMDARVWEKPHNDSDSPSPSPSYPTDAFHPARFLRPTGDDAGTLHFSLTPFEGSWLPFGSGANICPGRNIAKMHALLTVAMMVDAFECDILAEPGEIGKLDLSKFGMGVLGPAKRMPVRMRRRENR